SKPAWNAFEGKYRLKYEEAPNRYSALGYDCMNLIFTALENGDKNDLMKKLHDIHNFEGLLYNISTNIDNRNEYLIPIMTINQGKFVRVK
ncbi:MAG: hypothetical protein ABIA63_01915, partial [bacterium]